jgi:hypothetical protein
MLGKRNDETLIVLRRFEDPPELTCATDYLDDLENQARQPKRKADGIPKRRKWKR